MDDTRLDPTAIGRLLVPLLVIAVSLSVVLPNVPNLEQVANPDQAEGPENLYTYRLEFESPVSVDQLRSEIEQYAEELTEEGITASVTSIVASEDGRRVKVSMWMPIAEEKAHRESLFRCLSQPPVRVS